MLTSPLSVDLLPPVLTSPPPRGRRLRAVSPWSSAVRSRRSPQVRPSPLPVNGGRELSYRGARPSGVGGQRRSDPPPSPWTAAESCLTAELGRQESEVTAGQQQRHQHTGGHGGPEQRHQQHRHHQHQQHWVTTDHQHHHWPSPHH